MIDFGKRLVTQVLDDEVPDLAAGLAYRFLFAIFPFGIFLVALAAFAPSGWAWATRRTRSSPRSATTCRPRWRRRWPRSSRWCSARRVRGS